MNHHVIKIKTDNTAEILKAHHLDTVQWQASESVDCYVELPSEYFSVLPLNFHIGKGEKSAVTTFIPQQGKTCWNIFYCVRHSDKPSGGTQNDIIVDTGGVQDEHAKC